MCQRYPSFYMKSIVSQAEPRNWAVVLKINKNDAVYIRLYLSVELIL